MTPEEVARKVAEWKASIELKVMSDPKLRKLILDDWGSYTVQRDFRLGDYQTIRVEVVIKSKDILDRLATI